MQNLVDAVTQVFPDSRVDVDSLDRPWFRFANGRWAVLCQESVADSTGMDQRVHSGSRKRARSCPLNLLENQDISIGRSEF